MATVGSFVVNTYMNNENFMAGVKASQHAAKKMETGIGSSMDKINQKQLGNFGKNLMQGLGVISLAKTGADLALDFMKGFEDGTIKNFSDVAKKLQATIEDAIKNIPVAGAFFQMGRIIQEKFTGAMAEAEKFASWAKMEDAHNKQVLDDVNAIAKARKDLNDIVAKQVQKDTDNDPSISKSQKNYAAYEKSIVDAQKVREDAVRKKALDEGNTFAEEVGRTRRQIEDAKELDKLTREYLKRQGDNMDKQDAIDALKTANEITRDIYERGAAENAIGKEKQKNLEFMESELQHAVLLKQITQEQMDEALKYHADTEKRIEARLAQEKKVTDQIAEQKNLNDMIAESNDDQLRAQEDFDKTKAGLEEQAANLSSTTGVSSAIGDVKVAGAADFSIEKQLSMAQESLQAANDSVEYLRIIADQVKTAGATT